MKTNQQQNKTQGSSKNNTDALGRDKIAQITGEHRF